MIKFSAVNRSSRGMRCDADDSDSDLLEVLRRTVCRSLETPPYRGN